MIFYVFFFLVFGFGSFAFERDSCKTSPVGVPFLNKNVLFVLFLKLVRRHPGVR